METLQPPLEELVPVDIEKDLDETDAISLGTPELPPGNFSAEEDKEEEGEEGGEEEGEEEKEAGGEHVEIQPPESETTPPALETPTKDVQEDDETDDETDDESAFKKLEHDIQREYLAKFHPETKQINYDELLTLCKVIRNSEGKIIDALHQTIPFMTKYERTRVLGLRTTQINNGSEIFIRVDKDIIDGYTIAVMELKAKKMPFIIRRPLPNGASEYWRVEDLEVISY